MLSNSKTDDLKAEKVIPKKDVKSIDFIEAIEEAEQGPFYSVEESKLKFEKWIKQRKKR